MKTILSLLLCVASLAVFGQAPPILRNPFTTNSNPNGITVTQTNGANQINSSLPFVMPGGLLLGGPTNGGGTNGLWKTNWTTEIVPLFLSSVGTGTGFQLSNTNNRAFFKPAFADGLDKSTNTALYVGFIPSDVDPLYAPRVHVFYTRSGANGDVVTEVSFCQPTANTAFPGTLGGATLATNTLTGTGARQIAVNITTAWVLTSNTNIVVQVARDGDDGADTLTVAAEVQAVWLEIYRR